MNAEQRRAWFVLGVFGLACLGFVVLWLTIGFGVAWAAFAVFGLGGFSALIGRGEKADERDLSISRRATLAGGMASYGAFISGCMGVWFVTFAGRGQELISVHVLGTITVMGMVALFTARSLAILILYGRHVEADHA